MLWSLDNLTMHTQKVRLFQSFETKRVLLIISLVHDGNVQLSSMCHDKISYLVRQQSCWPPLLVFVFIEHAASLGEGIGRVRSCQVRSGRVGSLNDNDNDNENVNGNDNDNENDNGNDNDNDNDDDNKKGQRQQQRLRQR